MPGPFMCGISFNPLKLVNHMLFCDSWQYEHLVELTTQKRECSKNMFVAE